MLSVQLTLEFFERRKSRWLLPAETVNWEVWTLELTVIEPQSEQGTMFCEDGVYREEWRQGWDEGLTRREK